MFKLNLTNRYLLILISIIPFSIILGPSISLLNIILILIFFFYYQNKNFLSFFKNKVVKILILIYFYFLFNSFISIDFSSGLARNFGFLRFIILFFAINYLFSESKNINYIYKTWLCICTVVLFDSYLEFFSGTNILGNRDSSGARIVSFFKEEPIVAGYLNGFIFILFGYLFSNFDKKNFNEKVFIYLIILFFFFCILITGERSNTLKFLLGLFIFMTFNHLIKLKFKFFFITLIILLLTLSYFNSEKIKLRYGGQLIHLIDDKEKRKIYFKENLYMRHYKSGIEVFKNYPIYGVGNKNYRIEACTNNYDGRYLCNTHPHQIYLEFLSEHGLFGSILLLSTIFFLIFRNFKVMISSKNLIQLGSFSYLLINFVPILPSGSFFGDFNATLFWLNFSIFYASNSKTNIFKLGD